MSWKDNEISSFSDEEQEQKTLIASYHSDVEENEFSDLEPSYDEWHSVFFELHA